ncbi:hypothetical protein [Methylobacterium aerolatum]|uniref:Amino acid permease n=1 Tax=Methylobacterium aerolatum TaxID=418708 RepID=A0ABU0I0D1_9HYPH|nr:hypothetical protein [Methylobacterium aerolatum]MDQ0448053.1 amino acid permease [Methylobacterium aerolatum]GJD36476.1 hypothetical protein FMGBMHLM_3396 [Methylobacterium aerolatum]
MLINILFIAWLAACGAFVIYRLFLGARHTARTINKFPSPWVGWYWIATLVFCGLLAVFLRR